MKFQTRDYHPADLPSLCDLVASADRHGQTARALTPGPDQDVPLFLFAPSHPLGLERGLTEPELRDRMEASLERIARHVLVCTDRSGRLVACAAVFPIKENRDQVWLIEWAIDPACRTEELGRTLLVAAIDRSRELRSGDEPVNTPCLEVRALAKDADACALLQSVDLAPVRTFAILEHDMEGANYPRVSTERLSGIQIRSYQPGDGSAWVRAFNVAFANHWGDPSYTLKSWTRHVRSPRFRSSLSLVAVANQSIVGICHTTPSLIAGEQRHAHLHILGVRPAHRRRGLGSLLLAKNLCRLRRAGFSHVELDVDLQNVAAMQLYRKMDFQESEAVKIFRLDMMSI